MTTKNIAELDKNFALPTKIEREGLIYHNIEELSVHGVKLIDGMYRRMRPEDALAVSPKVAIISQNTAGGRVRFITDSPYIAIYVKYASVFMIPNYAFSATAGFDIYSNKSYMGCFVPPIGTTDTLESIIDLECEQNYGSSTTQGGCASRPGNIYENMVSRELDCDYINLGFGGNALGEEAIAKYIASLEMSAFVYDYDYNAPTPEHLESTHEKMFKIIREAHPDLPIIMMTAPKYYLNEDNKRCVKIIEKTYNDAVNNGDKKVRLIYGKDMLESVRDVALADHIHPNDIGFHCIAGFVTKALKEFL